MRIVVHDYSGHPFQVQLSRELARRGHTVLHLHCPSFTTGKGKLGRHREDPPGFAVEPVRLGSPVAKYSPLRRLAQELVYGRRSLERVRAFAPDVVLSSNVPLLAQAVFMLGLRRTGIRFVFWHQDVYSAAMAAHARRRVPIVGPLLGRSFIAIERAMARASDAVVPISDDFLPILESWGVERERITVIENWAPLDEMPQRPRDNPWARAHELAEPTVVLYSGTLGLKHDPELLVRIALRFRGRDDVRVVVVSEGPGADLVRRRAAEESLEGLVVMPFQPYDVLPDVLATGDILVVVLEPEAGAFSVPSKVLSYECAGRAILAAAPAENLAPRMIERTGSGIVVDPRNAEALADAAERLVDDPALRERLGAAARRHAEAAFDIIAIGDRFEKILTQATRS
jgi:putative colanic acid biosynthesis glycosyltransferase WcaI